MTKEVKEVVNSINENNEYVRITFNIKDEIVAGYGEVIPAGKVYVLGKSKIYQGSIEFSIIESLKSLFYNLNPDMWEQRHRQGIVGYHKWGNTINVYTGVNLLHILNIVDHMGYSIDLIPKADGTYEIDIQTALPY